MAGDHENNLYHFGINSTYLLTEIWAGLGWLGTVWDSVEGRLGK